MTLSKKKVKNFGSYVYHNGESYKIVMDINELEEPDLFGEFIREYAFKEDLGCYSCFDLIPSFREITADKTGEQFLNKFFVSIEGSNYKVYTDGNIYLGWSWDGDGTLVISLNGRTAINHDCKKTYGWSWSK